MIKTDLHWVTVETCCQRGPWAGICWNVWGWRLEVVASGPLMVPAFSSLLQAEKIISQTINYHTTKTLVHLKE